MPTIGETYGYDPEQAFYLRGLGTDAVGDTRLMMRRPEGDAFFAHYNTTDFPKTMRRILAGHDQQVAAFALPSTCGPEGYTAGKRKGSVRSPAPGETARFTAGLAHLDAEEYRRETQYIGG